MTVFFERLGDPEVRERLVEELKHGKVEWPTWETGTWPDHRYDDEVGWGRHGEVRLPFLKRLPPKARGFVFPIQVRPFETSTPLSPSR